MDLLAWLVSVLLMTGLGLLCLASLNLLLLALARVLLRGRHPSTHPQDGGDLPLVLIQLPLYNEGPLIAETLANIAALDWPRERLRVQVLDDSNDGSLALSQAAMADWGARGLPVELLHRSRREGFKAGALAAGLARSEAPLVAIFDVDFQPPPDFLRRTVDLLLADDRLGYVQTRWGYLNAQDNLLTRVQARLLDGHFVVEQDARARLGVPVPFNGTCGLWRRAAIDDAGGWHGDTLTEDLDLSLRACLRGWGSAYLADLVVPGLLPPSAAAWRAQQFRWNKGFVQVLLKLAPRLWQNRLLPPWQRLLIGLQLGQPLVFLIGSLCLLLGLPLIAGALTPAPGLAALAVFTTTLGLGGPLALLLLARRERPSLRALVEPVTALVLTSGLLLSNARAAAEALLGHQSAFVRTPKRGEAGTKRDASGLAELCVGAGLLGFALAEQPLALLPLMMVISGLLSFALLRATESGLLARLARVTTRPPG